MEITSCLLLLLKQSGVESCQLVGSLSIASVICVKLCIQYLVIQWFGCHGSWLTYLLSTIDVSDDCTSMKQPVIHLD